MPLLLRAERIGWSVEIFGDLPELPPFVPLVPTSVVRQKGPSASVEIFSRVENTLISVDVNVEHEPIFFEAVAYDIHFETDCGAEILLPAGATVRRINDTNKHYLMDFRGNVGFWDFAVSSNDGDTTITSEVFSRKIDYRKDYLDMRDDVSCILRNLAMTVNARTYGVAGPSPNRDPTLNEWFALIKAHFSDFQKLAGNICEHPHSVFERKITQVDVQKARRVPRSSIDRLLKGGRKSENIIPAAWPKHFRRIGHQVVSLSHDTPENRYFKGILIATRKAIQALVSTKQTDDEDGDKSAEVKFFRSIRPELREMSLRIDALLGSRFLKAVGSPTLVRPSSMVLHRHPLYSRFDKLARLICGGLSLETGSIPIGVKDTPLLYEYWCFIKIVQIMRARYELGSQSVVKTNRFKTTVTLTKGQASALHFHHAETGKKFIIVYNRLFSRLPTIAQKPDNVIQLASAEKMYVLDAKYRVQFDTKYLEQYGGPGPTTDDINNMHRYRDAIVLPHPSKPNEFAKGAVIGAAVLFPLPADQHYRDHKFYRSMELVEIGGIPFMPGTTKFLEEKLDKILNLEV